MFKHIKKAKDTGGFSLLEIVLTIIIIGLALSAIAESFIVGSAKSVNIVNEETAVNVAKQEMAALNYCRNGGSVSGVCSAFNGGFWNNQNPANYFISPQGPTNVNNECFYTKISTNCVDFNDTGGSGKIAIVINCSPPAGFIQTIVQTGWFASNSSKTCPTAPVGCPGTPGSCPYVTLSTVYANY